jgi:hypothetical protein
MDNLTIPFVLVPTPLMDLSLDFEENVIEGSNRPRGSYLAQQP